MSTMRCQIKYNIAYPEIITAVNESLNKYAKQKNNNHPLIQINPEDGTGLFVIDSGTSDLTNRFFSEINFLNKKFGHILQWTIDNKDDLRPAMAKVPPDQINLLSGLRDEEQSWLDLSAYGYILYTNYSTLFDERTFVLKKEADPQPGKDITEDLLKAGFTQTNYGFTSRIRSRFSAFLDRLPEAKKVKLHPKQIYVHLAPLRDIADQQQDDASNQKAAENDFNAAGFVQGVTGDSPATMASGDLSGVDNALTSLSKESETPTIDAVTDPQREESKASKTSRPAGQKIVPGDILFFKPKKNDGHRSPSYGVVVDEFKGSNGELGYDVMQCHEGVKAHHRSITRFWGSFYEIEKIQAGFSWDLKSGGSGEIVAINKDGVDPVYTIRIKEPMSQTAMTQDMNCTNLGGLLQKSLTATAMGKQSDEGQENPNPVKPDIPQGNPVEQNNSESTDIESGVDSFLQNFSEPRKSQLRERLNQIQDYNGDNEVKKIAIAQFVEQGFKVMQIEVNGCSKRVLMNSDGKFFSHLTKVELDYADHLNSLKADTEKKNSNQIDSTDSREFNFDDQKQQLRTAYRDKGYTLMYKVNDDTWNLTTRDPFTKNGIEIAQGEVMFTQDKELFVDIDKSISDFQKLIEDKLKEEHDMNISQKPSSAPVSLNDKAMDRFINDMGIAQEIADNPNFHCRVHNDPFMPLTICRQDDTVSLTQYQEIDGDLVMAKEIVFFFDKESYSFQLKETAVQNPFQDDELRGLDYPFANTFIANLINQGFPAGTMEMLKSVLPADQDSGCPESFIGFNEDGNEIHLEENGNRYLIEDGQEIKSPVKLNKDGSTDVWAPEDHYKRNRCQFLTIEEMAGFQQEELCP